MSHAPRRYSKALRYTLVGVAALALATVAAVAYFAVTFDPKAYTPRLADIVREKTGRALTVSGDVKLSFWPDLAIDTGPLALAEREGKGVFVTVDTVRLRVQLRPLLSREMIIDGLDVRGAHVNIVRDAQGRLNIDDLIGREGPPARFDIGRLAISDSTLTFSDLASGARYELSHIAATTGRLTNAVPTDLALTFDAANAEATWNVKTSVKSGLVLDLEHERTTLTQAVIAGTADRAHEQIKFNVQAARLENFQKKIDADGVEAMVEATGPAGTTSFKLGTPRFTRDGNRYVAAPLAGEIDVRRGETRIRAAIRAALSADWAARTIGLTDLNADIEAVGPRLPNKKMTATVAGGATVDLMKEGVHLALTGQTAGSRLTADIDAAGFAAPVYTFRMNVDKLDLDRFASAQPSTVKNEKPEDLLQPLSDLPATGTVRVGMLKSGDVTAQNVTLVLR